MKKILILFKTLKNKGLVNHLGVSVKSPNDAVFVIKNYKDFKFIQLNFNLMDQRAIDFDVFNLALSKKCKYYFKNTSRIWFFVRQSKV